MRYIQLFMATIFVFYFIIVSIAFAEPEVQSTSGQFVHKASITISGSSFGVKTPAAPLLWDDAEGKTVDSDSAVVGGQGALYSEAHPRISGGGAEFEPARTRYRTIPYRNTEAPHQYSNQYLAGGHYTYPNNNPPYIGGRDSGRQQYMDVLVTVDSGVRDKKTWFATWYYRLDPEWLSPCIAGTNHKFSIVNGGSTAWSQPSGGYDCNRGQNVAPCGDEVHLSIRHESGGCEIVDMNESVAANNPRLDWVRYQRIQHADPVNGMREIWVDNKKVIWYKDDCKYTAEDTRSFTIGGYFRWTTDVDDLNTYLGCADCYRYFDDMYVDTTFSRVMLANNQNYENATIAEPQIPSAWSGDSIDCSVNLGKLPENSTAYLFVFDSENQHNQIGYPVRLRADAPSPTTPSAITQLEIIYAIGTEDNSPNINISSPSNTIAYNTTENLINISGTASDDIGISNISWSNNRGGRGEVNNTSGDWTSWTKQNIVLQEGSNTITLTATDSTGQTSIHTITIIYTPAPNEDRPCGNNLLVGETSDLNSEGSMNYSVWKAFRWQAANNGSANCVKLNVVRLTGNQTSKDLAYAVYEDNNGEVGNLMVSGNELNYNWETIGTGNHSFSLDTVHSSRNIESGKWYWIALTTETNLELWFERASNSNTLKRGASFSSYATIPVGSSFSTVYSPNHYGWSVWE